MIVKSIAGIGAVAHGDAMKCDSAGLLLCLGYDEGLLNTRKKVLQAAGFNVLVAKSMDEARFYASHFCFQTILLCHTVPICDQDELSRTFEETLLGTPVLKLKPFEVAPRFLIHTVEATVRRYQPTQLLDTPRLLDASECRHPVTYAVRPSRERDSRE